MVTENVDITEHQAAFIQEVLKSGKFSSVSEAIRAGIRLLQERLDYETQQEEALRRMIDKSIAGGFCDKTPQEIVAEAEAKYKPRNA